jgi:hypothetical protein
MTLIEVLVAMTILVVGVIGVVPLLDTANKVTDDNVARDNATALVREDLEKAREMPFLSLVDPAAVAAKLVTTITGSGAPQTILPAICNTYALLCAGLAPVAGVLRLPPTLPGGGSLPGGFSIVPITAAFITPRHGIPYTTTISSCVLDDPSDGIGAATGAPCKPLPAGSGGGGLVNTSGSTTLNLNVLGIQVTGAGALAEVVCSLFGTRGSILDNLLGSGGLLGGLISAGADQTFCSAGNKGNVAVDRQPVDATAITSTVTWPQTRSGRGGSVTQRIVVSGPRVTS